ncbi:aspartate carbamoyltransferase [uncultured archaeon]|nr:aspartate carbamoyltransferase [uncultured archaeon]
MVDKTLKISKIKDGTVIDHIPAGKALKVLNILNISEDVSSSVSIGIHVPSGKFGYKDVIKIENRFLEKIELDMISLIAPEASISIVTDYSIKEKFNVELPQTLLGLINCANQNCITNGNEPVKSEFETISRNPISVRCRYCEREMNYKEIQASM